MNNLFYSFDDPLISRYYRGEPSITLDYHNLTRSILKLNAPLIIRHCMGGKIPYEIFYTTGNTCCVHKKIIDIFTKENISGWDTYDVLVYDKKGIEYNDYSGLSIKGNCGPILYKDYKVVYCEYPAGIFPKIQGISFDIDKWDRSDLFMFSNINYWLVTEKFCNIFRKYKIKNVKFTPLFQVQISIIEEEYEKWGVDMEKIKNL